MLANHYKVGKSVGVGAAKLALTSHHFFKFKIKPSQSSFSVTHH
jgi:hypothetical protein